MMRRAKIIVKLAILILPVAIVILFAGETAWAQMSGPYTVGSGKTYTTLKDAFDDVELQGLSGDVTFQLFGTTTENGTPTLNAPFGGVDGSGTYRITCSPFAGETVVIDANGNANILNLTDIVRFTMDGSTGVSLTLTNCTGDGIIVAKTAPNASDDIIISNLTIGTVGTVAASSAINLSTANIAAVTIDNCIIGADDCGISISGGTLVTITNCDITGTTLATTYGIYLSAADFIYIGTAGNPNTITSVKDYGVYITAPSTTTTIDIIELTTSDVETTAGTAVRIANEYGNNVTIDGCTIDGGLYGIHSSGASNLSILNSSITSCTSHGALIDNPATAATAAIVLDTVTISAIGAASVAAGIKATDTDGITINNCTIETDPDGSGIEISTGSTISVTNCGITGTVTTTLYGIYLEDVDLVDIGTAGGPNTISSILNYGLYITASAPTTSVDIIRLSTNSISATGTSVYLANANVKNVLFQDCLIGGAAAGSGGLYGIWSIDADPVTVTNGAFLSRIRNTASHGILIDNTAPITDFQILNTTFGSIGTTGSGAAIRIANEYGNNVTIDGCTIDGGTYGIHSSGASNLSVLNSTMNTSCTSYGILIDNPTAAVTPGILLDTLNISNVGTGSVAAAIGATGTDNISIDNCTLTADANGSGIAILNGTTISITNCGITGTPATTLYGIYLSDVDSVSIGTAGNPNTITSIRDYGLYITASSPTTDIDVIELSTDGIDSTSGTSIGLENSEVQNVLIQDCTVGGAVAGSGGRYGIWSINADLVTVTDATLTSTVRNTNSHGIFIDNTATISGFNIFNTNFVGIGTSNSGAAVRIGSVNGDNVQIDGCTIDGGSYGVHSSGGSNLTVSNSSINSCTLDGIYINNSTIAATSGILIDTVSITLDNVGSGDACIHLYKDKVQDVTVTNCALSGGYYGFWSDGADDVNFNASSVASTTYHGIMLDNSDSIANTIGIVIDDVSTASIGATGSAITLWSPNVKMVSILNCNAANSSAIDGGAIGIYTKGCDGTLIQNCEITSCSGDGLFINNDTASLVASYQIDNVTISGIGTSAVSNAIYASTTTNISITNCTISADTDGTGVTLVLGCNSATISGTTQITVGDSSTYAIYASGSSSLMIDGVEIDSSGADPGGPNGIYLDSCSNATIINSTLQGAPGFYAFPIYCSNTAGILIQDNTLDISSLSDYGIYLVNMSSPFTIDGNTIDSTDSIGIRVTASGATSGASITSNKVKGASYGIYLDGPDGTVGTRCLLANNMVYNQSIGLYMTGTAYWNIYNNSFYGAMPWGTSGIVKLVTSSDNNTFRNNIIQNAGYIDYASSSADGYADYDYSYCFHIDSTSEAGFDSDFNAFYGTGTNDLFYSGSTSYQSMASWNAKSGTPDLNSIVVNPWYVSPATDDLHLWYYSDCKGKGTPLVAVVSDIDDEARDASNPDLGADEDLSGPPGIPPISSDVTVGTGAYDYPTLQAALTDLVGTGVSAPITVFVYENNSNVIASAIRGSSSVNVVTVQSTAPGMQIDAASTAPYALDVNECSNIIFDGFAFINSLSHGIYVRGNSTNVEFRDCSVSNVDTNDDETVDPVSFGTYPGASGIYVDSNAGDDITVTDCNVTGDAYGIRCDYGDNFTVNGTLPPGTQITGMADSTLACVLMRYSDQSSVTNNTINGPLTLPVDSTFRGYGVRVTYCENPSISGNTFAGDQPAAMEIVRSTAVALNNNDISINGTNGIQLNNSSGDINGNSIEGATYSLIGISAEAIDTPSNYYIGGTNIIGNTLTGGTVGLNIIQASGDVANKCTIANNVITDSSEVAINLLSSSNWNVYFNTCFTQPSSTVRTTAIVRCRALDTDDYEGLLPPNEIAANNTFRHNIFYNGSTITDNSYIYAVESLSLSNGFVSNNNDLFVCGTNNLIGVFTPPASPPGAPTITRYSTLAAWTAAYGQDAQSINVDPDFTDLSTDDYTLWDYSPCQNKYANTTGITVDINAVARSASPDLGAYEFNLPMPDLRMSGTYDVGGATPDFATIDAAYNALCVAGISDEVTIVINDATSDPLTMARRINGTSSSKKVTFTSGAGVTAQLDGQGVFSNALLISSAQHVTFSGVEFVNSLSSGVLINNLSFDITFDSCSIYSIDTDSDESCAAIKAEEDSNDNITVQNCTVEPDLTGVSDPPAYGDNGFGIYILQADDCLIKGNTINGEDTVYSCIYIIESLRTDILANIVYSGYLGVAAVFSNGLSTDPVYIANNIVYGSNYSIYSQDSAYVSIYFNTLFGLPDEGECVVWIGTSSAITGTVNFNNNIVNNTNAVGLSYLNGISIDTAGSPSIACNYNDYYRETGNFLLYNDPTSYGSLSTWRTATSYDLNTISVEPVLVDEANADFRLLETINNLIINAGMNLTSVAGVTNVDYLGTARPTGPYNDIGAYEAPVDDTPPDEVGGFSILTGTGKLYLYWTNPTYQNSPPYTPLWNVDFYGVLVLRSTGPITDIPTEGQPYSKGMYVNTSEIVYSDQPATPGEVIEWIDDDDGNGLTPYQTYYYRVFTYDDALNYSTVEVQGSQTPTNPIILAYDPTSFNVTAIENGPNPSSINMTIMNDGDRVMDWSVTSSQSWMSISPLSGTSTGPFSTTGDSDQVTISFTSGSLSIGTYPAYITIIAVDPEPYAPATIKTIPILLKIETPPGLSRNPSTLTFAAVENSGVQPSSNVQIWNSGTSSFTWTAVSNVSWLTMSPSSGSVSSQTTDMAVTPDITSLSPGLYVGKVTISAVGAGMTDNLKTVNVSLTVTAKPADISTNEDSFVWNAIQGGSNPEPQDLVIWNSSGGSQALSWTLSENLSWMVPSALSGTSTGLSNANIVSLSAITTNLTIASNSQYSGTLTLNNQNTGQTKLISVQVVMMSTLPPEISVTPSSFVADAIEGALDPLTASFLINNSGGSIMTYLIDDDAPWLTVNPTGGQVVTELDTIQMSIDSSDLSAADSPYTGNIFISSNTATNSPVTIPITLNVHPATGNSLTLSSGKMNPANTSESSLAMKVEMLQIELTANSSEDIVLTQIVLSSKGTADESIDILPDNVKLYEDLNDNGFRDSNDIQLGTASSFDVDDGDITFAGLGLLIPAGETTNILAVYALSGTAKTDETLQSYISSSASATATTLDSQSEVQIVGAFPMDGGLKTIGSVGTLVVAQGPVSPETISFGNLDSYAVVEQIVLSASSVEQIAVGSITFNSIGSGVEPTDITRAYIVNDIDSDGQWDQGEYQIGVSQVYTKDNSSIFFTGLSEIVPLSSSVTWILIYDFSGNATNGSTFLASVANEGNVSAKGISSNMKAKIMGTPVFGPVVSLSGDPTEVISPYDVDASSGKKSFCFMASFVEDGSTGLTALMSVICLAFLAAFWRSSSRP